MLTYARERPLFAFVYREKIGENTYFCYAAIFRIRSFSYATKAVSINETVTFICMYNFT